ATSAGTGTESLKRRGSCGSLPSWLPNRTEDLDKGGGDADRLRRAEASIATDRRGVPPAGHATSESRRPAPNAHRSPTPLGTGAARRSHVEETQALSEGSDGEHSAPAQFRKRHAARRAGLTHRRTLNRGPAAVRPGVPAARRFLALMTCPTSHHLFHEN